MSPDRMREVRQYQLSLVLVGMCLASKSERERIFAELSPHHIKTPRSGRCLRAIKDEDVDDVDAFFASLGVHRNEGEKYSSAIIRRLDEMHGMLELADTVKAVMFGDVFDVKHRSALERLDAVRAVLTNQKEEKF